MFEVQLWNGARYFTIDNGMFETHAAAEAFVNSTTMRFRQYRIVPQGGTFWLHSGTSQFAFAAFTTRDDQVEVVALIGYTTYIDRTMSVEEARREWNSLVKRGWHRANDAEVTEYQMDKGRLRMLVHD